MAVEIAEFWPWLALAALGAYHGINPAMGWLFAVALGLQEQSRPTVLRAFAPIALGHAASVAIVIVVVSASRTIVPIDVLKWVGASLLIAYGLYRLWKNSHPRWVGMRVGFKDLTTWSFLMASAHGAGLILVPVLFNLPGYGPSAAQAIDARDLPHSEYMLLGAAPSVSTVISQLTAIGVHTVAMFAVMAVVAVVVYEKVGLALLRKSWFNMDRLWAAALVGAGVMTLLLV